ncbi:hypothetical protein HD599_002197 [Conyzicola lurida]|uniref:Uncharacterized protein n=1 Tax=Conyzicola lurida TaxID=1172621 RepID=A0A841ANH6_9MICO|nr:hypothetical protein [Conyzicola lurida]MBB5843874.1 hypothetical protein [Conyzicola lurida]
MTVQTLRPQAPPLSQYGVGVLALVAIVIVASLSYDDALLAFFWFGAGTLVLIAVVAVFLALHRQNSSISLEPGAVWHRSLFGRTRRVDATSVATVLVIDSYSTLVNPISRTRAHEPTTFFLDHTGATVLRLRGSLWSTEAMSAVVASVTAVTPARVVNEISATPQSVSAQYPRAISFFEAHPMLVAVIVSATALVLLIVVLVAVAFALS